jgi:membrane associated rhomboid family serine protease
MRFLTKFEQPIFEAPGGMVQFLLGANLIVFGICFAQSGTTDIPAEILLRNGAMSTDAIERHEYWRMFAYGFLHANPVHLAANMFLLVLWGGHLEKRVGALYFAFVYISGLAAGAVVSKFTSPGSYLLIGASGALSAVFGALLYLWASGKSEMGWEFFAISVGIVVALIAIHSRIDWGAHLRGLVAGMVCCGCLDVVEKVNGLLLRCKFPEFVKMNAFLATAVAVISSWAVLPSDVLFGHTWLFPVAVALAALAIVKAIDLALMMKKGLVLIVVVFALANAALVLLLRDSVAEGLISLCGSQFLGKYAARMPFAYACTNAEFTLALAATGAFVVTVLAYWSHLVRGISDVGFVGNTLRAERLSYRGL